MRLHELSCPLEKDIQSVFFHTKKRGRKKKTKLRSPKEERMSWALHNFSLHCIVAYKTGIYFILGWSLHVHAFQNPCFTSGYDSIDFSLYTNCQNPIAWFIGLNVLCFFHKTQRPLLYDSKDYDVFSHLCFQRLQCLPSFTLSKTTMPSFIYAFKDYNVFSHLHFQRMQYL